MSPTSEMEMTQKPSVLSIKKRDGRIVPFTADKIFSAVKKAFNAQGIYDDASCHRLTEQVGDFITEKFQKRVPTA